MTPVIPKNNWWVWSDTHFGHKNIVQFQQRPETHETIMLSNWCERVRDDDTILHLGDVFLGRQGNPARWARILARMPGRKLMMRGNHDHQNDSMYQRAGFELIQPFVHAGVAFTHRPITARYPGHPEEDILGAKSASILGVYDWHTNIHGHIHGNTLTQNHHDDDTDPVPDKTYINVSVEALELAPRQIGSLVSLR